MIRVPFELHSLSRVTLARLLTALVHHNVELYQSRVVVEPPWTLRWRPDAPSGVLVLPDVFGLNLVGYGSCGPLAAAYAAWTIAHGGHATIDVLSNGAESWHVVARSGAETFDPQILGGSDGTG